MSGITRTNRFIAAVTVSAFLIGSLSGCVSPYVERPALAPTRSYQAPSLGVALTYAQDTQELYRKKIIELGDAERAASIGFIGLGTALILAGALGAHRDTMIGGAGLAGGGFAMATFLTDKRRASIYVAGMKALICAQGAVSPLNLDQKAQKTLESNVKAVETRKGTVNKAVVRVEGIVREIEAAGGATSATQAARQDVQTARQSLASATSAQGAVDQLYLNQSMAGNSLKNTVDDIDTVVLDALRGTEGSLQAVPQIIAGLAQSMQLMAPGVKVEDALKPPTAAPHSLTKSGDEMRKLGNQLTDAVATLRGETALLDADTSRVTTFLAAIDPPKVLQSIKTCKVEDLPGDFKVEQSELQFKAKTADKKSLRISGGGAPFFGEIENNPAGTNVEHSLAGNGVLTVAVTDQVQAGTHRMFVQDKTRQKREIVMIKIAAAEAGTTGTVPPAAGSVGADAVVKDINDKGTVRVGTTDVSIKAEKNPAGKVDVTYNVPAGSSITDADVKSALDTAFQASDRAGSANVLVNRGPDVGPHALIARRGEPTKRWGPVVENLVRDQVQLVQNRLCVKPQDGLWGPNTQKKLEEDRQKRRSAGVKEVPMPGAMLTPPELRTLLTAPATNVARCPA
jgi:hypothetical protein